MATSDDGTRTITVEALARVEGEGALTIRLEGTMPGSMVFLLSCLFAMGVAALGGAVIGIPCLRLRGDYLAIATLGFGEIVRIAIQNTPVEILGGAQGLAVPRVLMKVNRSTKSNGAGDVLPRNHDGKLIGRRGKTTVFWPT